MPRPPRPTHPDEALAKAPEYSAPVSFVINTLNFPARMVYKLFGEEYPDAEFRWRRDMQWYKNHPVLPTYKQWE